MIKHKQKYLPALYQNLSQEILIILLQVSLKVKVMNKTKKFFSSFNIQLLKNFGFNHWLQKILKIINGFLDKFYCSIQV